MAAASVLEVGNCDPDHGMIKQMLSENFEVRIDRVMFVHDALARMREKRYDLVFFNRLIFEDGSEGIDLLKKAKSDPALKDTPIMMISNFEDSQAASVAAGGEPGFGKKAVFADATIQLLSRYLSRKTLANSNIQGSRS
jgi:two-component system, chemotaxis family, chemotaxis protein CheY